MVKVLVGIISKNRETILPKAIQSAINQDYQLKKIIVFDDNSTDNTKNLENQFQGVEWIFSEVDRGYLYARNKLMSETDCDFYCSLDDDSWFLSSQDLSIACNYMIENPDVAAIAFDILSPDKKEPTTVLKPYETNLFIGCGHLLRLSAVKQVGYYKPFPGLYAGEEKDLCIRLLERNFKIMFLPNIKVWHDKTLIARNIKSQCISNVCNDLTFAFIRMPILMLMIALPYKIILHLKIGIKQKLTWAVIAGISLFSKHLFTFKLNREPVSLKTFKKFQQLY